MLELSVNPVVDFVLCLRKLDIIIGSRQLQDQFEWDVSEPAHYAELFATTYAKDLGLAKEFE